MGLIKGFNITKNHSTDTESLEYKAKLMKKRNVQLVHEHFEEVLTQ